MATIYWKLIDMSDSTAKRIVVVLGMHRSGTSLVTRGLQALGVDLGTKLMPPSEGNNDKGFWEDLDIHDLNEELLHHFKISWDSVRSVQDSLFSSEDMDCFIDRAASILSDKTGDTSLFGFKDPRLCVLMPFWLQVFQKLNVKLSYVIAYRDPWNVATSLEQRDGFDVQKGYYLWLVHMTKAVSYCDLENTVIVDYDRLLAEPSSQIRRLAAALSLKIKDSGNGIRAFSEQFIDSSLRRNCLTLDEVDSIPDHILDLAEFVKSLAGDQFYSPGNTFAARIVQFDDRLKSIGPELAYINTLDLRWRSCSLELQAQEELSNQASISNNSVQEQLLAQISTLNNTLQEKNDSLDAKCQEREELLDQVAILTVSDRKKNDLLSTMQAELWTIKNSKSQKITQPLRKIREISERCMRFFLKNFFSSYMAKETVTSIEPDLELFFNIERINITNKLGINRLTVVGWCFSSVSVAPLELQVLCDSVVVEVLICDGHRVDVAKHFSKKEIKHSSLLTCGFTCETNIVDKFKKVEIYCPLHDRVLDRVVFKEIVQMRAAVSTVTNKRKRYSPGMVSSVLRQIKNNPQLLRLGLLRLRKNGLKVTLSKILAATRSASYVIEDGCDNRKMTLHYQYTEAFSENAIIEATNGPGKSSVFALLVNDDFSGVISDLADNLQSQFYQDWVLYIISDDTVRSKVELSRRDARIHIVSGTFESCKNQLLMQNIDYLMLFAADMRLTRDALYEINAALNTDFSDDPVKAIYFDHDEHFGDHDYRNPHYKPAFSLWYFLSYDYIGKTLFFKVDALRNISISNTFDMILGLLAKDERASNGIVHIEEVLCHIEEEISPERFSATRALYADRALAIEEFINNNMGPASVFLSRLPGTYDINFLLSRRPLVSIIIPFKDQPELLEQCIQSVYRNTDYENFEVIGISNNSAESKTLQCMSALEKMFTNLSFYEMNIPFNYSKINNVAVQQYAKGEYILFLNNDIEIISGRWIESMLGIALQPKVGCVGAKLIYPDYTIQHAGVILGVSEFAAHYMSGVPHKQAGYENRLASISNYSAVTGACMMVEKSVFLAVGMFNDADLPINFNDIDLSLKIIEAGYEVIFTPHCEAFHYESVSRGKDQTETEKERFRGEVDYVLKHHREILLNGDPFLNSNLAERYTDLPDANVAGFMRIAMLCARMQKGYGVDLVISEQAQGLTGLGFKVDVYTLENDGYFSSEDFNIYQIDGPREAINHINGQCYDVAIAHTTPFFELLPSIRGDVYTIAYEHGDPTPELFPSEEATIRQSMKDLKLADVYPVVNQVIAISNFIAEDIQWPAATVIYNGADHLVKDYQVKNTEIDAIDIVKALNLETQKMIILCVSRLGSGEANYKGLDSFVELTKQLGHERFEYLVVGKGDASEKKQLEAQSIKVILNASRQELVSAYRISDALVSFSKWEGFNLPLVEAQSFAKPGYALDHCAHSETSGTVFSDMTALAQDMQAQDKHSLRLKGLEAYAFIQKFSWKINTDAFSENLICNFRKYMNGVSSTLDYEEGKVSICILTKNKFEFITECISSIIEHSRGYDIEVLIGDTGSTDSKVLDFYDGLRSDPTNNINVHFLGAYHFSKNNNSLAAFAVGEHVLFLNNDTKVLQSDWLLLMLKPLDLTWVGIVGPKLLFENQTIQHAGVEIFTKEPYQYVGWHPYSAFDKDAFDACKLKVMPAVTGACLLIPHLLFDEVGGFTEVYAEECQDIDLCFKVALKGFKCVYTPKVELVHYENGTRTLPESSVDRGYFLRQWRSYIDNNVFNQSQQSELLRLNMLIKLDGKVIADIDGRIAEISELCEELNLTFKYPFYHDVKPEWKVLEKAHKARLLKDDYEDNIRYDYIF
jgi:GT2 family glycosyltransferase